MLSRATAGLVTRPPGEGGDTFIFALPGSTNAVKTAMQKLILPEVGHLLGQRS
jgi:molybdenum cofactor biosynthesis protein B